jgi:predicted glycosyl hydrolase (DUF1957 family)
MVETLSIILHWNTDYAEIPRKKLPRVVETSYKPMVAALENWKDGTVCFNITGHTFEYLEKEFPELLDRIKALVEAKVVELVATGYSHPILPLLPPQRITKQIEDHITYLKKTFNITPKGMWPPELAISPLVLSKMKQLGITWTAADYEHFTLSQTFGNDLNPFEQREPTTTELLSKAFWAKGLNQLMAYYRSYRHLVEMNQKQTKPLQELAISSNKSIHGLLFAVSWTYATQFAVGGHVPLYNTKKHLKAVLKYPGKHLPLYGSDVEFFGYRQLGPEPAQPADLIAFLRKLNKKGIKTISPSTITNWPDEPSFIGAGCWSPDKSFRIWRDSEDNREYYRRTKEIYEILSNVDWDQKIIKKIELDLRIVENSDPRGWAPLPERKQEAYEAMLSIYSFFEQEGLL